MLGLEQEAEEKLRSILPFPPQHTPTPTAPPRPPQGSSFSAGSRSQVQLLFGCP